MWRDDREVRSTAALLSMPGVMKHLVRARVALRDLGFDQTDVQASVDLRLVEFLDGADRTRALVIAQVLQQSAHFDRALRQHLTAAPEVTDTSPLHRHADAVRNDGLRVIAAIESSSQQRTSGLYKLARWLWAPFLLAGTVVGALASEQLGLALTIVGAAMFAIQSQPLRKGLSRGLLFWRRGAMKLRLQALGDHCRETLVNSHAKLSRFKAF